MCNCCFAACECSFILSDFLLTLLVKVLDINIYLVCHWFFVFMLNQHVSLVFLHVELSCL